MAMERQLTNQLNNNIEKYIQSISSKFNIDRSDLLSLWNTEMNISGDRNNSDNVGTESLSTASNNNVDHSHILNCTKSELVDMCKIRKLRYSGTKKVLISRLTGQDVVSQPKSKKNKKEKVNNEKTIRPKKSKQVKLPSILVKLAENRVSINISRNQFNNFEHKETSLIFDQATQRAIGTQNSNGSINVLTPDDINQCNKYKFAYVIPENLDEKTSLEDVKVDELEEEAEEKEGEINDEFDEDELLIEEEYSEEEELEFDDDEDEF
jgi:hypothetical protein